MLDHLEHRPARVISDNLLQNSPVRSRLFLGDALAPLEIHGIHLFADVVPQHRLLAPDLLLEG